MPTQKKNVNIAPAFRPPEADQYMPEQDSALLSVHEQARGTAKDERDLATVAKHTHDGSNSLPINIRDIAGFIRTVSAAPTASPKNIFEQFAIYRNGATKRFYWYDTVNKSWDYAVGV